MGRAERRRAERKNRIEGRKDKILMTSEELTRFKQTVRDEVFGYGNETLMTCFSLADHRVHGFGVNRRRKTLQYIEEVLMMDIINDEKTVEDYKQELIDETGVKIEC
jgi:hypothetical protein